MDPSPSSLLRRGARWIGLGIAVLGLAAVAVVGLTRVDDLWPRATDTVVAGAPEVGAPTGATSDEDSAEAAAPTPTPTPGPESAPTRPPDPAVTAAHESGGLPDLDGLLFHNAGTDPFAWRPDPRSCEGVEHAVVVDRAVQRGWFCEGAQVTTVFPLTSSDLQPDPGVYEVYAKDMQAWSWDFGPPSTMTHFVAFTRGKFQGARIAFHSVPVYSDGSWAQPPESVGTMEHFGDSAGCIRLLPEDAQAVWDFLDLGGSVRVIS